MRFNITDNVVMRGLSKICDMACLNVIWLICCIPIFTIGAATTALYTVMLKMVKNEEGYIFRSFFRAFKENFKQSTIMWLILLAAAIVWFIDIRIVGTVSGIAGVIMSAVFLAIGFVLMSMIIYIFPLTARYVNSTKATFKNALILSVAKLPYSLLMVAIAVAAFVISNWSTGTFMLAVPFWLIIGWSLLAWVNSYLLRRVFATIEGTDDKAEEEEKK